MRIMNRKSVKINFLTRRIFFFSNFKKNGREIEKVHSKGS